MRSMHPGTKHYAELIYEGTFALLFLAVAVHCAMRFIFFKKELLGGVVLHSLACSSCLVMAATHVLLMTDVPEVILWRYMGRLVTTVVVIISLGYTNGRLMAHILVPLPLAVAAWCGLAVTAGTTAHSRASNGTLQHAHTLHWYVALSVSSAVSSWGVLFYFAAQPIGYLADVNNKDKVYLDLAVYGNLAYLALWFAPPMAPLIDTVLNGFVDVFYVWGFHHLLLKRIEARPQMSFAAC